MDRRHFLQLLGIGTFGMFSGSGSVQSAASAHSSRNESVQSVRGTTASIDRKALVTRHHPTVHDFDPLSPFTVGNGEFAFTADVTGLQTFPEYYEEAFPLCTQAHWGWHSFPNPHRYYLEQTFEEYDTYGRGVSYASDTSNDAAAWLRANPHRLHLGEIGFQLSGRNDSLVRVGDIRQIEQTLHLWEGILRSAFEVNNRMVEVETCCHPEMDQIAVRVRSSALNDGRIGIRFRFPYGSSSWGKQTADWDSPEKHLSRLLTRTANSAVIRRRLDGTLYYVFITWEGNADFSQDGDHLFSLRNAESESLEFTCRFSPNLKNRIPETTGETLQAVRDHWEQFWHSGGAIDLSGSTDPRAEELERRIVLSQYLTAVQCAGSQPPQETGLTFNSWHGKFHLEMHWWHGVHFVLWERPELFERSLDWYRSIMSLAREKAMRQGYDGVRWPKMVGPDGRESPSGVGVFLIWQQPHFIYYAELLYRYYNDPAILQQYKNIVFQTAEFMASYAWWEEKDNRYMLGPPLIPAQEIYPPESAINPAFEVAYWRYGLATAQTWRERLGLARSDRWERVLRHLPDLPQKDGLYQNAENAPNTFTDAENRRDHPTLLGAYGILPGGEVDPEVMRHTLQRVMQSWNWESTWGWDYPMIAMTAARVGEPELAIEALLQDAQKNRYLVNGHTYQDERLPIYLPGNGGLLTAVAMMAAGWEGAPDIRAPGFPQDGTWSVKYENLTSMP